MHNRVAGQPKNPAAVSLGRLGGKARAASLTAEERSESASKAVAAFWANLTFEERAAEMKRRAKKRKK